MPTAPRVDDPRLPDLEAGAADDLLPGAVIEAVRFDGAWEGLDLTDAVLSECLLDRLSLSDCALRGIRVSESMLTALNAPVLAAARSRWRDTVVTGSRIGSAELFDSSLTGVRIEGSKLGYVNLRGAILANVIIANCTIDELDIGGSSAKRVAIVDCEIGTLDVTRATLADVDLRGSRFGTIMGIPGLRGATIDETQLAELAPHLAAEAGLTIR